MEYSSQEITKDLYAKMIKKHGALWKHYRQILRSHAVLKDDLQRLTGRFANPLDVRSFEPFAILVGLTMLVAQHCSVSHLP